MMLRPCQFVWSEGFNNFQIIFQQNTEQFRAYDSEAMKRGEVNFQLKKQTERNVSSPVLKEML